VSIVDLVLDTGFFAAAVRLAIPLLFGTLSELTAERSGVLNLGIEGMMLSGALAGFGTASATGSLWLGVLAAIAIGMTIGAVMAGVGGDTSLRPRGTRRGGLPPGPGPVFF